MNIDITTKNIDLDEPLRVFVNEKIGGLEKYIGSGNGAVEVRVEIGKSTEHHRNGLVFYAEANMKIGGRLLRGQAYHNDLRAAIVDVKEALKIEINKFKEKRKDLSRTPVKQEF